MGKDNTATLNKGWNKNTNTKKKHKKLLEETDKILKKREKKETSRYRIPLPDEKLKLYFPGGGSKGFYYLLVLILYELEIIDKVDEIGGVSAGAIFGQLVALGIPPELILELAKITNFESFKEINDGWASEWLGLTNLQKFINAFKPNVGIYKDKYPPNFFKYVSYLGSGDPNTTFEQQKTRAANNSKIFKKFSTNGYDLLHSKELDFNAEKTPKMPIFLGTAATMRIPVAYSPLPIIKRTLEKDDKNLDKKLGDGNCISYFVIDGGAARNDIRSDADKKENEAYGLDANKANPCAFGFKVNSSYEELCPCKENDKITLRDKINGLLKAGFAAVEKSYKNKYKPYTININNKFDRGTIDFEISPDEIDAILKEGAKEVIGFWEKYYSKGYYDIEKNDGKSKRLESNYDIDKSKLEPLRNRLAVKIRLLEKEINTQLKENIAKNKKIKIKLQ